MNSDETNLLRTRPRLFYLRGKATPRTPEEDSELYDQYLASFNEHYQQAVATKNNTKAELDQLIGRGTIAHIMQEKPDQPMAYILFRGEYDKRRDQVQPATPDTFPPPFSSELPAQSFRTGQVANVFRESALRTRYRQSLLARDFWNRPRPHLR